MTLLSQRVLISDLVSGDRRSVSQRHPEGAEIKALAEVPETLTLRRLCERILFGIDSIVRTHAAHILPTTPLRLISAMNALNRPARPLPAVISRRMPHRHRCTQQEPAGEKNTF